MLDRLIARRFLKDTDEGLLEFRDDEGEDDGDEGGDDEDDRGGDEEDGGGDDGDDMDDAHVADDKAQKKDSEVVTSESLKSWCQAAQKNASIGAVRQVTRLHVTFTRRSPSRLVRSLALRSFARFFVRYRIACHYGVSKLVVQVAPTESLTLASCLFTRGRG